jgi:MYXO-CTERM domain-containing protein
MSYRSPLVASLIVLLDVTALASPAAARTHAGPVTMPVGADGRRLLPAWETPWERHVLRQKDSEAQLEAFRTAHPELYGVTTTPQQPVRHYAEYDPVDAVYYAWEPTTFNRFYRDLTHALLAGTDVEIVILHHGAAERTYLEAQIAQTDDASAVTFIDLATAGPYYVWQDEYPFDRSIESFWTVDYGPYWVEDGNGVLSIIDPRYYPYRVNDDAIPAKLGALLGVNVYRPDLDYEGGNLLSDGHGTCFSTGMHVAENLPLTQAEVEQHLLDYFGCSHVIWLWPAIGEGTGHIDMFFKNASDTVLVLGAFDPADDAANAELLDRNAEILAAATNASGAAFEVLRVPMPANADGVFRSYTNGIVVNDLALVPVYANHAEHEAEALAVFAQAFPGRTVVPIESEDIIEWGGAIHCVTRTRPVGSLTTMEATPTDACGGASRCVTGCGDITFDGDCVWGQPVYCDGDAVYVEVCYPDERCGWDLAEDYFYCVKAGCATLAPEGECRTSDGDAVAVTCSEEGFPQGERCAAGEECGRRSDTGVMGCRLPCTDACEPGDSGCDGDTGTFTCGEADDGDDCYDRIVTACGPGETCSAGVCACTDACDAGSAGCDVDGNRWSCGEAGDGDACRERIVEACGADQSCHDGRCVTEGRRAGCDCQAGGDAAPGLVPLVLLIGLALRRRRGRP